MLAPTGLFALSIALSFTGFGCGGGNEGDPDGGMDVSPLILAVSRQQELLSFHSGSPNTVESRAITGVVAGQTVRGIDLRPGTNQVYLLTATANSVANDIVRQYTISATNGEATAVGQTALALPGHGDIAAGFDLNPSVDRFRLVNVEDENARVHPDTGALAGDDVSLNPATAAVVGAAYVPAAPTMPTTLFGLDRNTSGLVRIGGVDGVPSPNGGVVTAVGPLSFTMSATRDAGFDISPAGVAFAAISDEADQLTRLYQLDLQTGAATAVGLIGNGASEIVGLTVLPN